MPVCHQPSPTWEDLNRQIGQLFLMGFEGTTINDEIRSLIENYYVGSILLTAQNLKSAERATQLIFDLQNIAHAAGHPVPLAIALELDHGELNNHFDESYLTQFPGTMGLAAAGSTELAREVAEASGRELNAIGVNWVLRPTRDVLTGPGKLSIGVRGLSDGPQETSSYNIEYMKGYHEAGIATCGKQDPADNNLEVPGAQSGATSPIGMHDQFDQSLHSFRTEISQGVDAVMLGSIVTAPDDTDPMHNPFSLKVAGSLLRAETGFEGVLVSPCVGFETSNADIETDRSVNMAVQAGCDVILLCAPTNAQQNAILSLEAGVKDSRILKSTIQQSLRRVLDMKSKCMSWEKALNPPGLNRLLQLRPPHFALCATAYDRSVTVVRDHNHLLPLPQVLGQEEEILLLTPLVKSAPQSAASQISRMGFGGSKAGNGSTWDPGGPIMSGEAVFSKLGRAMSRQGRSRVLHASYTAHGLRPLHEDLIARSHVVIVVTTNTGRNLYQTGFTKHVSVLCRSTPSPGGKHKETPMVVVAASSPLDFALDESIGTYLCTYDFTEMALQSLVRVLFGHVIPSGELPSFPSIIQPLHNQKSHWLVENWNQERDLHHLEILLQSTRETSSLPRSPILAGVSPRSFLVRDSGVEEAHFVVRDSSTKAIFGFCSTHYFSSTAVGAISSIIVDPSKRRLSIGQSLHGRAIGHLLQRKGIKGVQLGCRIPSVFLGLPKMDQAAFNELKRWFAKMGWSNARSQTASNMILPNLPMWTAPDDLSQTLPKTDLKFDLIQGLDYVEAILGHVKGSNAETGVAEIYKMALADKGSCAIIRAKRADDVSILGTVVLYKNEAKLARFVPALADTKVLLGGISSPVVSPAAEDPSHLVQGLILLGVRQLKKQGASAAVLDCVGADHGTDSLRSMSFSLHHTFEMMSCPRSKWTMMSSV